MSKYRIPSCWNCTSEFIL